MLDLIQAQRNAVSELLRTSQVIGDLGSCFDAAGHRLYFVGGSAHGTMPDGLGHDLDSTTPTRPGETHVTLRDLTPVTWDIGRDFGTIGAMKREGDKEWQIGVTALRTDAYEPGSRKPVVAFGERIEEDLVHRDFTVNATAVDIVAGEFADSWGGLYNPAGGVLRTPTPTEVSFGDDPLRTMRAMRFTPRPGFRVTPGAQDVMRGVAERIAIISAECVQAELTGLLSADSPRGGLDFLVRTGVAGHFLPELPALRLERDEHMRHKDVYAHLLIVPEQAIDLKEARGHRPDIVSRPAALLYNIDKSATRRFKGLKATFHHHDVMDARLVTGCLKALRYSMATAKSVVKLVKLHLRFYGYGEASWNDSAAHRYMRDAGDELERLHIPTYVNRTTHSRNKATRPCCDYEELEWCIDELATQGEIRAIRPDLDGVQIMEILGTISGPEVGETYRFLLDHRMDSGSLPEDETYDLLLTWWKDQQPQS